MRYKYKVYNLDNELLLQVGSMSLIAKCMGVSENTVLNRLKRKVTKNDQFWDNKYKFNIERIENGSN